MKRAVLFCCGWMLLSGCGDAPARNNPLMIKGDQYRDEGNPELAERFYRRFLEKKPGSRAGHLALATLCDEALNDPARALYHYNEYLRLAAEDDPERGAVRGYRELVRAKLRSELNALAAEGGLPAVQDEATQAELRRQAKQIEDLKQYILGQQRQIETLRAGRAVPERTAETPAAEELYTVRPGDTPGKIAQKFYGSAQKYRLIMEANQLRDAAGLRVGQVLKIPAETP